MRMASRMASKNESDVVGRRSRNEFAETVQALKNSRASPCPLLAHHFLTNCPERLKAVGVHLFGLGGTADRKTPLSIRDLAQGGPLLGQVVQIPFPLLSSKPAIPARILPSSPGIIEALLLLGAAAWAVWVNAQGQLSKAGDNNLVLRVSVACKRHPGSQSHSAHCGQQGPLSHLHKRSNHQADLPN